MIRNVIVSNPKHVKYFFNQLNENLNFIFCLFPEQRSFSNICILDTGELDYPIIVMAAFLGSNTELQPKIHERGSFLCKHDFV